MSRFVLFDLILIPRDDPVDEFLAELGGPELSLPLLFIALFILAMIVVAVILLVRMLRKNKKQKDDPQNPASVPDDELWR